MRKTRSLAAAGMASLFATLSAPAGAQPTSFTSLPDQGAVVNTTCQTGKGPRKPGDLLNLTRTATSKPGAGIAQVLDNECRPRLYNLDENGTLSVLRPSTGTAPTPQAQPSTPAAPATTLPDTLKVLQMGANAPVNAWWTTVGLLPAQVDRAAMSVRLVPAPSLGQWREAHCLVNGVKVPLGSGVILDNRTLWFADPQCRLVPLVTVTKDAAKPLSSDATRFDSARQLLAGLEQFYTETAQRFGSTAEPSFIGLLRGNEIAPGASAYKAQPGGIVVDESIAGTIGTMRAMRGMADDSIPAVVQVSPAQPAAATALSGDWWSQPGLLPTSPQGTIASTGRDPSGNCRVTLNGAPLVSVAPGSIILPDTTRAFAILADCKAEPLITLPLEQNPNTGTTIAGGSGPRNPVRVVPGQSQNIQNTVAIPLVYATAVGLVTGLGILGLETGALQKTYQYLKTLVIPGQDSNTAAQILQNRNNMGMNDQRFGQNVQNSGNDRTEDSCDEMHEKIDLPTCRAISARRGPAAAARCFASANQRYGACIAGRPLPPLDTWSFN